MLSYDAVENQSNFSQIEKAVLRAKKEWEATFDAIPDMLLLTNSEGCIARCNQAATVKLRSSFGELVGRKFTELFPEVEHATANGIEMQLFGDHRWYRILSLPVSMENELLYQLHFFQDITRKKIYEMEILREEQYYEALFAAYPDSLAVLDDLGVVRNVNPAFEHTFGYSNTEARGHSIHSLLTAREFRVAGKSNLQKSDTSEQTGTFRCVGKDGHALMLAIRELPVALNGIDHGKMAVFHKVTSTTETPATEPAGNSTRDALVDRLEGKLLPVIQNYEELTLSLGNDALTPKQITLKAAVSEQMEQLRQLLAEIHDQKIQLAQHSEYSSSAGISLQAAKLNDAPTSSQANPPEVPLPKSRILLVEDNPINQKLMLRLLQKRGYMVAVAENGIAALRALSKQSFDLIFMDIQMPEMDGIEATRRIRVREHDGQHQVIIALTAEGPGGDKMECLKAGMDDYLAKPVDIDRLIALLERYTDNSIPTRSASSIPTSLPAPQETGAVNLVAALPRFGGEVEVYFNFLNHFIKQLKQTDQKMRAAYKTGDIEQLHAISHGLKGTAANFEAKAICDLASELEDITSNNSLVGAFPVINQISIEIPQVEAFYHNQMLMRRKKTQGLTARAGA